ncbi:hypothetical protein, partial [Propionivibrio sp.]|uniref:hypothetical protein n=1 Tax=Propionivibrio sp. TaxID=2212460 RepID=UPI0025F1826D
ETFTDVRGTRGGAWQSGGAPIRSLTAHRAILAARVIYCHSAILFHGNSTPSFRRKPESRFVHLTRIKERFDKRTGFRVKPGMTCFNKFAPEQIYRG